MCDYDLTKQVYVVFLQDAGWLPAVSRVFVGTACLSDCKVRLFYIPLFVMANIYKCFECNSLNANLIIARAPDDF